MKPIRIASRSSKLAMAQTHLMKDALEKLSPGLEVSVVPISTTGDRDRSDFLYKSQVQGLFTSEVENALLDRRADVAVHSLKDLPTSGPPDLMIAAMPLRESAADVLVARKDIPDLDALPAGATVGTSSLRRIAQIKRARPDLCCVPLRGNVESRIGKVTQGEVDAAVMAHAGINRLGLTKHISAVLPLDRFIPAPAQGVLAVQVRRDDVEVRNLVAQLDDASARAVASAEREVLAAMHGGCSIPLGVYANLAGDTIHLDGMIADMEGQNYIRHALSASLNEASTCARKLAQHLLASGGQAILDHIRHSGDPGKK